MENPDLLLQMNADQAMDAVGVEEHVAMLMIPKKDYKTNVLWQPAVLETRPEFYFVQLNGERIRFVTTPASTKSGKRGTSTESTPPRASAPDDLGVPHLDQPCCSHATLRPEYRFPDYRLAAAVFDLSNGAASACALQGGRVDTIVSIENQGTVTIEATMPNGKKKSITVSGTAQLITTNLPTDSMTGSTKCRASHAHNMAYSAMLLQCKKRKPKCPDWKPTLESCEEFNIRRPGGHLVFVPEVPPEIYARTDAQCSNTQWP